MGYWWPPTQGINHDKAHRVRHFAQHRKLGEDIARQQANNEGDDDEDPTEGGVMVGIGRRSHSSMSRCTRVCRFSYSICTAGGGVHCTAVLQPHTGSSGRQGEPALCKERSCTHLTSLTVLAVPVNERCCFDLLHPEPNQRWRCAEKIHCRSDVKKRYGPVAAAGILRK